MRVVSAVAVLLVFSSWAYAENTSLRLVNRTPMPGVAGRIDHMAVDTEGRRLFVAALANNSLEVIDLQKNRRSQSIRGFSEPQGVIYIPGSKHLVVSNGGNGVCQVFDATTLRRVDRIDLREDADNLRYDAAGRRLFVAYGNGGIAIFDARYQPAGVIPLAYHPEAFALSPDDGRMFVNVPTMAAVVVADIGKKKVIETWKLPDAGGNFPMAIDEVSHLVLIGTRKPAQLIGMDMRSGRIAFSLSIDDDPDDIFVDAHKRHVYISCGAGYLDVLQWSDSGQYQLMEKIPTAPGARTSLFVPELHRLFLAVPRRGRREAAVWIYDTQPCPGLPCPQLQGKAGTEPKVRPA